MGHPLVSTPNLDKLAAEGVLFEKHYAGAVPCSPARACLYTGLYQMNNRVCVNGSPLDRRHDTLALAFRRLGYEPTLFGYTDQGHDPRDANPNDPKLTSYEGQLPGFDSRVSLPDKMFPFLSWLESKGYNKALSGTNMHIPVEGVDDPPKGRVPQFRAEHTETAFLADEFKRWLGEQKLQSTYDEAHRWFAHVSFLRPHPPFTVPSPYDNMVAADDVADFSGFDNSQDTANLHPLLEWIISRTPKSAFIPGTTGLVKDWTQQDLKQIAATYFGMIAEVDAQIGLMIDALKASGNWDNTIIVFTSDHGEQLGDHTLLGKHGFFESSYHIPLIIRDPGSVNTNGQRINAFTESVDVFPTLLDLLGADIPAQIDGRSLHPFMSSGNTPRDWRDAAHWEFDFRSLEDDATAKHFKLRHTQCNMSVLRRDDFKYVHFAGLPSLLFDLKNDPGETRNLAGHADYLHSQLECAEQLLSWRAEHLDQSLALYALTKAGPISVKRTPNSPHT